jgi:hypothetical protein
VLDSQSHGEQFCPVQTKLNDPVIKLNVGGKRIETLKSTLLSIEGTYFVGLLECGSPDNEYFIDRDGAVRQS